MHRDEFRHPPPIPAERNVTGKSHRQGQALRRSLNAVASLLHDSKEPAFVVDRQGRVVHWNQAAEAFFGVPGREAVGRHCATVVRGLSSVGEIQCTRYCPLFVQAQRDDSYVVSEMRVPTRPRPVCRKPFVVSLPCGSASARKPRESGWDMAKLATCPPGRLPGSQLQPVCTSDARDGPRRGSPTHGQSRHL